MVLLLSLVNVFNYMDRMALSILAPSVQADLGLSDGQLGLLIGLAFSLFYALCGIPIARWADRGIRRNVIAVAVASWSVMTALSGAAQNFWHLFVARVGVGAGEAGSMAPGASILCDYVPFERRAGIFAIHSFGLIAGMFVGMALAGALGEMIGWRWTFVVLGLPGLGLALIVRLTLREPVRGRLDAVKHSAAAVPFRSALGTLWRCRTYRLLVFLVVVAGFAQYGLYQWWPSFYARVFGLALSSVGVYLGTAIGIGSAAGLLIGGLLANRVVQRDVRLPLKIGAAATFLALPAALGSLWVASPMVSMMLVALTALLWSVQNGPVIAIINSVVTARMRATAQAMAIFLTSVLGFGLGPLCVGVLSDMLLPSFGAQSLRYALLLPVTFLPIMVVALYVAARELPNDLRAAGAHLTNDGVASQPVVESPV